MSYQFTNAGGGSNVYYTFPYDHNHSNEFGAHYHGNYQQPAMGQSYYGNFLNRTNQQTSPNFPVRIDMNMTAYVRPPAQDLFYETAQLPTFVTTSVTPPQQSSVMVGQSACGTNLLENRHHLDFAPTADVCFTPIGQQHRLHHWTYLQRAKSSSLSLVDGGACKTLPIQIGVKSDYEYDNADYVINAKNKNERETKRKQAIANRNVAKFQCFMCAKKYCRQSTLKAHLRQHSGEKPYVCNICGKNFSQSANLNAHKRVHTGEKPFSCPICCRPFSQSSSLMTHKRTHSGERPYRCTSCDKAFTDSSTLTKHIRTHTGCKPYACRICHFSFSQSGNLSRHMKTHLKRQENPGIGLIE